MASATDQVQSYLIGLLQTALPGVTVVGDDSDSASVSVVNRVIVGVGEYQTKLSARDERLPAAVLMAPVTITAKTNAGQSTFDAWRDAIDGVIKANGIGTYVHLIQDTGGDSTMGDQQVLTRTCTAMFRVS